jgi:hypothetical protein
MRSYTTENKTLPNFPSWTSPFGPRSLAPTFQQLNQISSFRLTSFTSKTLLRRCHEGSLQFRDCRPSAVDVALGIRIDRVDRDADTMGEGTIMCKSSALAVLRPGGTERPEHRSGILVDHSKEGGRAFVRYSPARFPVLHGIKAQAVSIGERQGACAIKGEVPPAGLGRHAELPFPRRAPDGLLNVGVYLSMPVVAVVPGCRTGIARSAVWR